MKTHHIGRGARFIAPFTSAAFARAIERLRLDYHQRKTVDRYRTYHGAKTAWQVARSMAAANRLEQDLDSDDSILSRRERNHGAAGYTLEYRGLIIGVKIIPDDLPLDLGDSYGEYVALGYENDTRGYRDCVDGLRCDAPDDERLSDQQFYYQPHHCTWHERLGHARKRGYARAELTREESTFRELREESAVGYAAAIYERDEDDNLTEIEECDSLWGIAPDYVFSAINDNGAVDTARKTVDRILDDRATAIALEIAAARPDMQPIGA